MMLIPLKVSAYAAGVPKDGETEVLKEWFPPIKGEVADAPGQKVIWALCCFNYCRRRYLMEGSYQILPNGLLLTLFEWLQIA